MQDITGISRNQMTIASLEDTISADNPIRFIDAFVDSINIKFKSKVRITGKLRKLAFHNKTQRGIQELANLLNPKIRGWIQYYGKISRRSLQPIFYYLHNDIIRWILNKYKNFKGSKIKAVKWLRFAVKSYPNLFYHWELGYKLV